MATTSTSELRARRDLFRLVLNRLLAAKQALTRVSLFQSDSAQNASLGWQRDILRYLVDVRKIILREGPIKNPSYRISGSPSAVSELRRIAGNSKAIDTLLLEANKWALATARARTNATSEAETASVLEESLPDDANSDSNNDNEPQIASDVLETLLKYAYMTAQALIDVRDRIEKIEQMMQILSERRTNASHPRKTPERDETVEFLRGILDNGPVRQTIIDTELPETGSNTLVDAVTSSTAASPNHLRWMHLAADVREAASFLETALGDGPLPAPTVRAQASQKNISPTALNQAMKAVKIVETPVGGLVRWSL